MKAPIFNELDNIFFNISKEHNELMEKIEAISIPAYIDYIAEIKHKVLMHNQQMEQESCDMLV